MLRVDGGTGACGRRTVRALIFGGAGRLPLTGCQLTMLARKRSELEQRAAAIRTAIGIVGEVMHCDAPDLVACPRFRAAIDARVSRLR